MTSKAKLKKLFRFFQTPWSLGSRFGNKLFLEHLESREVMNRATWISTADGDWGNAANWDIRDANNNVVVGVPTINDDVIIDLANSNPVITVSTNAVAKTVLSTKKISINAGLLQISNASTIAGNVEIKNSGTLQTDSQLTLSGTVDWIQGTITDTGTSTVTISGTTNLTGTATISGTTLTNLGTLNISSGGALTFSNGTLVNESTGTIDIQNDNSFTATNSTLQNKGLLKKSSGSNTVTLPSGLNLDNTGSVEVYSGTFKVTTTSQISTDQITNIKTLTAGKWKAVNGTLDLAASNSITINQGELTFGLGGAITGTGALNSNDGVLRLLDGVNRGFVNFVNQSSGLIEFSGNSSPVIGGSFTNNGVIKKTGLGTSYIFGGYSFYNNGTIQADSGNLKLGRSSDPNDTTHYYGEWTSSILNASAGATVDIYGNYNFNNTSTAIPTLSGSGSGIIRQQGRFAIAGGPSVTVNFADGLYQMDGGEIRGANSSSRFINTGFISVGANSGNFYQVLNQGNIVVNSVAVTTNLVINDTQGIIELAGNSSLVSGGNDGVTNDGTIKKTGSGTSYIFGGSGLHNNGIIRADAGTLKLGRSSDSNDTTHYAGSWTSASLVAAAGAVIDIYGNYNFNNSNSATPTLTGTGYGIIRQQGVFGIFSSPSVTVNFADGLYQMDGGEIRGANSSSRFINTGFISAGANGGHFYQFLNQGLVQIGSSNIGFNFFENDSLGTILFTSGGGIVGSNGSNTSFTNRGTIRKTGASTVTISGLNRFDQENARMILEGGNLVLYFTINGLAWNNVSFEFANNATIENQRATTIRGFITGKGQGAYISKDNLNGSNLGAATLDFAPGTLVFDNSNLQPDNSTGITNIGEIQAAGTSRITSTNFLNSGTIKLQPNASLSFPNIKNISTSGSINTLLGGKWIAGNGASFVVDNNPNIQVNKADVTLTGTGSFNSLASAYSNYGSLTLVNKNYGLPSGFENLGTLTVQNTSNLFANLKTLTGGQFINKGSFILGPNTALSAGSFEQNSVGVTELQIQGSPSSGLYGRISSTGNFSENGELAIKLLQGFGPTQGDTYPIMNYASKTGSFSTVTGLTSGSLTLFQFNQGTTSSSLFAPASATDLKVTNISQTFGSVAANSQQTFTWTVLNDGGINASSNLAWKDTVYLSSDRVIDNEDIVLGTVEHTGGLAAGQTYTQSLLANVPYFVGDMHVLVATDIQKKIADVNRANNVLASNQTIYTTLPSITVGTPANSQSLDASGFKLYEVTLPGNEDIRFAMEVGNNGGDAGEIYIRQGAIPFADAGRTDQEFSSGVKPSLVIPNASAGKWYVLVRGNANSTFNISASIVPFGIQTVSSNRGANSGKNTVFITGAAFDSTTTVQLTSNSTVIATGTVYVVDRNHISVEFDLTGKPLGTYDIKATKGGLVSTKAGAFDIVSGNPGELFFEIKAPAYIRSNRIVPISVKYYNPGDTQVEAKIFKVYSNNGKFRLPGQGDHQWQENGIFLFGINPEGKASVLPSGFSNEINLEFMPIENGDHIFSSIGVEYFDDTQNRDTNLLRNFLKPTYVSQNSWNIVVNNLISRLGQNTFGNWNRILGEDADHLSSIGLLTYNYNDYYNLEINTASNFGNIYRLDKESRLGVGNSDPSKFQIENLGGGIIAVFDGSENPILFSGTKISSGSNGATYSGPFTNISGEYFSLFSTTTETILDLGNNIKYHFDRPLVSYTSSQPVTSGSPPILGFLHSIENSLDSADVIIFERNTDNSLGKISYPSGDYKQFQYNQSGKIISIRNIDGSMEHYSYDISNTYLVGVTTNGQTTTYGYVTQQGLASSNLINSVSFSDGSVLLNTFDIQGRQTSATFTSGSLSYTENYSYPNNLTKVTTLPGNISFKQMFDMRGNPVTSISNNGFSSSTKYNGNTISYYSNNNFLGKVNIEKFQTTLTDSKGFTSTKTYNDFASISSIKDFNGYATQYTYDANHFLESIIYSDSTKEEFFTDASGQLLYSKDRSGKTIFYEYDADGRLIKKIYSDGSEINQTYDSRGNLLSISKDGRTINYTYDSQDFITKVDYGNSKYIDYTYDNQGRKTSIVASNGFSQSFTYDSFGRLTAILRGNQNQISNYVYDAHGNLLRTNHENGSFTEYTYNSDFLVTGIFHRKQDNSLISSTIYSLDLQGLVLSKTVVFGTMAAQTTSYSYDSKNQLVSTTLPNGTIISYTYDANGNRIRSQTNATGITNDSINYLNQLIQSGDTSYEYDANGNLVAKSDSNGITNYRYDLTNRLTKVINGSNVWEYLYDPAGNRCAIIFNGQRTDLFVDPLGLDGLGNVISEITGANTTNFYQGVTLESLENNGNRYSYGYDITGNTMFLTDSNQNIVNQYDYLPFGEMVYSNESVNNPYRFVGGAGVRDDGNSLYFMRARYYDAAKGRFTQVDPSGISGSPTNPYKYAVNNPISAIDPSGLCPECPPDISGIPFTTGVGYVNSAGNVLASGDLSYDLITKLRKQLLESFRAGKNVREYMKQFQDITLLAESNGKTSYYTFQINRILANAAIAEKNLEASSVTSLVQDRAGVGALGNAGRTAFALVGVVSGAIDCYNFGSSLNNLNEKRDLYSGLQALHDGGMVFFDGLAYSPHPVLRGIGAVAGVVDTITNPDGPINAFQYLNNYESLDDDILPEDPERRRDFLRIRERRSCEEKLKQCLNIEQINPNDPNDIIGPTGFGPGNSIELSDMAYRVRFENKSNALAPAAEVFVTEVLDTDLDLSTFRFTGAGFGSQSVTFNTPLKSVYARVDDRANSGLFVDITGNLNTSTRTINWVFRSIDPTTLQVPADATIGFLPPNTTSPMGEGYLTYTVRPNANSANGTVIDALASIIFDGQQTINTPLYTNTIDIAAPTSTMNALGATQTSTTFNISWTGTDDAGQSGIQGYDIYVSDNGGPYNIFLADTTNTTASFTGVNGHTYRFKSVAYDNLGFVQLLPANAQTTTTIQVPNSGGGGGSGGGSSGGGGGGGGSGGGSSTPNLPTTLVVATGNTISIVNSDGTRRNITGEFANGTRARLAVTDNSSTYSIVTAPPRGGDPVLDILNLSTGKSQRRIQVFDNAFRGGISMDTADIDGDGIYEFLVGAGPTGGPHVKLLRADGSEMLSFFAFDSTFNGGTSLAFADVDGNGTKEIVVGAGPGGGPHVKVFQLDGTLLRSFFAFDPGFRGGVFLAAGDLGGDNAQEIVVGAGAGGGPVVKIFDGNSLQVRGEFFAYDSAFLGGVMVALQDYNLDGRLDLVTGAGKGGSPHVKVFDGPSLNLIDQFFAGDPALTEGAFV